jgi:hypothetical protein
MGCIEELKFETLLSYATFKECREYIRDNYKEHYTVKPGYKIFDSYIIGVPPILIGVDNSAVVFPYTKPCHGTFLLRIEGAEEIARLRAGKK